MKLNSLQVVLITLFLSDAQGLPEYPILDGDPVTMNCPIRAVQWIVTTNNNTRLVASCDNISCTNKEPNDYLASGPQSGLNNGSLSLLTVKAVRRPGLDAECRVNATYVPNAWRINAIVRPTKPVCGIPVPQSDGMTVSVICQTFVYPSANCTIYIKGQLNVITSPVTYNHTWSSENNLTLTTCMLTFKIKDTSWNSSAVFSVGAYPNVNFGNSYDTNNNWSLLFVQDKPRVISLTANSQSKYLVVTTSGTVTLKCIAIGQQGATYSLYDYMSNKQLASGTIPVVLEYTMRNVIQGDHLIGCEPLGDPESRKLIHVYVGTSPVNQFTANLKSDALAVTQGSDISLDCTGDDVSGHKLIMAYHFNDGGEIIIDEADLPGSILHVYHNVPCGNLSAVSCRIGNDLTTERRINISVECLKSSCCDSSFPIIPVAAGTASGAALIILIIITVCLCRQCRRKKSQSETTVSKPDRAKSTFKPSSSIQRSKSEKYGFRNSIKTKRTPSSSSDCTNLEPVRNLGLTSSPNGDKMLRNAPKRMSILRSSTRKKLASSVYSGSLVYDMDSPMNNEDVYHVNLGYSSQSDTSLHRDAPSSSSSVAMVASPYGSTSLFNREYDLPYAGTNRDVPSRPQNFYLSYTGIPPPTIPQTSRENIQSTVTRPSRENIQSTVTRPSRENIQSTVTRPSRENIQSTVTRPSGENIQSTVTRPSREIIQSTVTRPSRENIQSSVTRPSRENIQSTKTRPSRENIQSTVTRPSRENIQSTVTRPSRENMQVQISNEKQYDEPYGHSYSTEV